MRNAKAIIQEYLERGYSIECLRVLAESRSEPLCSEMLEVLNKFQLEKEISDVACVTEPAPTEESSGNAIFFVAEDFEPVSKEPAENIEFMFKEPLEEPEETVAEILTSAHEALTTMNQDVDSMEPVDGMEPVDSTEPIDSTEPNVLEHAETVQADTEAAGMPLLGLHPLLAASKPETKGKRLTRKERRRMERMQKKIAEKPATLKKAADLQEIVLARSEGTDTMLPEKAGVQTDDAVSGAAGEAAPDPTPVDSDPVIQESPAGESIQPVDEAVIPESEQAAPDVGGMNTGVRNDLIALERTDSTNDASHLVSESDDYLMLIAGAGQTSSDASNEYNPGPASGGLIAEETNEDHALAEHNVILFRGPYPAFFQTEQEGDDDVLEEHSFLRVLPRPSPAEYPLTHGEGGAATGSIAEMKTDAAFENAGSPPDREAEERIILEREYQDRLDEFARRFLELQSTIMDRDVKLREWNERFVAQEAKLDEMRRELEEETRAKEAVAEKLANAERICDEKA
ncbi:MAG: hypothetical protein FWG74_08735, partial [Planctomycetes bacterium]|nr:hypothetical protein [Planctomycetota bacterium]